MQMKFVVSQTHIFKQILSGNHASQLTIISTDDWQVSQMHKSKDVEHFCETVVGKCKVRMVHHVWSHIYA